MQKEDLHLSILIPTYNHVCLDLVGDLCRQASRVPQLSYEVLVADDGSTMPETVAANRLVEKNAYCRYLVRKENKGRSAIRNFLAREAQYELLLFIDSHMSVIRPDFLACYLSFRSHPLVYGGYAVSPNARQKNNLRYRYELSCVAAQDVARRSASPYSNFHTSNFMIHRHVMLSHPLDERFKRYGYEDVLYGKQLKQAGIAIIHIDNPVGFDHFETNERFVEKTAEGLRTLHEFREELRGYSRMLSLCDRLGDCHLTMPLKMLHACTAPLLKRNLQGSHPSLFLFKVFRLAYYFSLSE